MKKTTKLLVLLIAVVVSVSFYVNNESQVHDANVIFCEYYDTYSNMPVNVGNRFTKGNICVIANLGFPINQNSVLIQLDRYNNETGKYEYYNSMNFRVNPAYSYIYFNNIYFGLSGHYRVFLLYRNRTVVVSGLVEII